MTEAPNLHELVGRIRATDPCGNFEMHASSAVEAIRALSARPTAAETGVVEKRRTLYDIEGNVVGAEYVVPVSADEAACLLQAETASLHTKLAEAEKCRDENFRLYEIADATIAAQAKRIALGDALADAVKAYAAGGSWTAMYRAADAYRAAALLSAAPLTPAQDGDPVDAIDRPSKASARRPEALVEVLRNCRRFLYEDDDCRPPTREVLDQVITAAEATVVVPREHLEHIIEDIDNASTRPVWSIWSLQGWNFIREALSASPTAAQAEEPR